MHNVINIKFISKMNKRQYMLIILKYIYVYLNNLLVGNTIRKTCYRNLKFSVVSSELQRVIVQCAVLSIAVLQNMF